MPPTLTTREGRAAPIGRPKAILFDWDNTLVDTWPAIHDALNATLAAFDRPQWSFEETRRNVRQSMRDSFPVMFGDRWQEAGRFFYDHFESIHIDLLEPRPGASAMLRALQAENLYLGVVSNKQGDILRTEVAHLGWDLFFSRVVGATDATRDKPAADPVDMALIDSGIRRGPEVWFAGDTDIDLECAVNAGCVPVLVREEAPQPGEFRTYPPIHHVEGCLALSNLVLGL